MQGRARWMAVYMDTWCKEAITCANKDATDVHVLLASHKQIADSREEANVHACYLRLHI